MTYVPKTWVDGDCVMAADMNHIENGIDIAQGDIMVLRGLLAALPATDPTLIGRLYFATDTSELFRDNGAGWDQVYFDHGDLIGLADNDHPQYVQDIEYTALGDILVGTGAGTFANLGVGALGEVLTVAGGTATWAAAAAGGAWNLIAETILGAPAATVTFAAIPGTYRTLVLQHQARTDDGAEVDVMWWRANADAGANYDWALFWYSGANGHGGGGGRAATEARFAYCEGANSRSDCFGPGICYWPYYALTTVEKYALSPMSSRVGDLSADLDVNAYSLVNHWRDTSAITTLTFVPLNGPNFVAGSRFTLYGIT